jgi:UDP-N-acetylmuramoyl-tripeptide--D-alanyl-D-alanine ligase
MRNIARWWLSPKFPEVHVKGSGKSPFSNVKKWLVHPFKRRLARAYLKFLQKFTDIKVVGITGSAGKTTTKEMLCSILKFRGETTCTRENIDPIYNIPDTILSTPYGTKYLILEMGVEYPGEMDFYLWLAKPNIAVITNIYPTHTEFFGNEEGVFKEKKKLAEAVDASGFVVLNLDNQFLKKLGKRLKTQVVWFGKEGEVFASKERIVDFKTEFWISFKDTKDSIKVQLPLIGSQYVNNALAASAVAHRLGATVGEVKKGLEQFNIPPHRMRVIKHHSGALILDDTYNSNPEAAKASISTFLEVAGNQKKVIVFGDMLELGKLEKSYHRRLGEFLGQVKGVDVLICVGNASKITGKTAAELLGRSHVEFASDWKEALVKLKPFFKDKTAILIKGSRSIGLDNLVAAI